LAEAVAVEQAIETRMDTAFATYHMAIMPPNMPPKKFLNPTCACLNEAAAHHQKTAAIGYVTVAGLPRLRVLTAI
jgi:hypothetical protein